MVLHFGRYEGQIDLKVEYEFFLICLLVSLVPVTYKTLSWVSTGSFSNNMFSNNSSLLTEKRPMLQKCKYLHDYIKN